MTSLLVFPIAQRISTWLPITETWIDSQVRHLPDTFTSHVLCDRLTNIDRFPAPNRMVEREHLLSWQARRLGRVIGRRWGYGPEIAYARKIGIRLVHSHFGNCGWEALPLVRALRCPHVVSFYGYDVNQLPVRVPHWRGRYRELFGEVDRILCEGPHMARCVVSLGAPSSKVIVHHLGVELDRLRFSPRQWRLGDRLRILIAASFREKKGICYGIAAIGKLSSAEPIELTLIGDAASDQRSQAEKARIERALKNLPANVVVRRLGYVDHATLHSEALSHHILLVPSVTASDGDTEGGAPVTAIEALATGMPVVGTTHCDIPGIMPHELAARLVPERDSDALAAAICRWVQHPQEWARLLISARQHVEREFNAEIQGQGLAAIYRSMMN